MKIAIVRGVDLNKFEMQNYEPLAKKYDMTAYSTYDCNFDICKINIPIKKLHSPTEFMKHVPFSIRIYLNMLFGKIFGDVNQLFGLEEELKDKDIVHVAEISYGYSYQAIKLKGKYGTKVVVTVWENIPFKKIFPSFLFPFYLRFLDDKDIRNEVIKNADAFIAITNRAKETLILEGVQKEKIHVIPAGVDLNRFKPREKDKTLLDKLGLNENDFVVLFVGRLARAKGIYDLLYAAKIILEDSKLENISIKFVFVGSGPERNNMIREIKNLGLTNNVKLFGSVPYHEIQSLYNLAEIFVLPSRPTEIWQEQFGMVLAEAMASGNAVISTLSGSIPEVVGGAGLLVQPNDPLSLYYGIKKLMLNKKFLEKLKRKSRIRAEKKFDSIKIAAKIEDVYKSII